MAEQQSTSGATTNTFTKGLHKDLNDTFLGEGVWTHARNAVNNSHDGQLLTLSNEPSNLSCIDLPFTLISAIPLVDDEWCVFMTDDDTNSEIGIFDESKCTYRKVVNDPCLGFKTTNLITGVYRDTFDCGRKVYFADALNSDRVIDIDKPPFIKNKVRSGDCYIETDTNRLDCEKLRLAPLLTIPNLNLRKAKGSGTLPNGSYQITIAYTINQIKVTDYLVLSEVQPLFSHLNLSGALELVVSNMDQEFDEFELVIISTVNQQTVAKRLGIYSTHSTSIYIDTIDPSLPTINLNLIPLRTPAIEKSDAIYPINNYLLRVGIYAKPDINYQPQANKIKAKWVSVQYPSDYYRKGGNYASYMRDEQYSFFIRWVYNTGDKSASYHIPGRVSNPADNVNVANADAIELADGITPAKWQVYNTAEISGFPNTVLPDGGIVIAEGDMGYWQSNEKYPDMQPDIWDNLCGKNIRHHKFPDNILTPHFENGGSFINILGVRFEGITPPLDNDGNVIISIIGYEILRGSREGQKTIVAKGLLNNMREYDVDGSSDIKGLFSNYPYNDLRPDYYLTTDKGLARKGPSDGDESSSNPATKYRKDIFSFHSPETTFTKPFLSASSIKIYSELSGTSLGSFEIPYKHPKHKLATKFTDTIVKVVGVMNTLKDLLGAITGADGTLILQGTDDIPLTQDLLAKHRAEMFAGTYVQGGLTGGGYGWWNSAGAPGIGAPAAIKRQIANTAITIGNAAMVIALSTISAKVTSEKLFHVVMGLIPVRQYSLQYNSHGYYDNIVNKDVTTNHRRSVLNSSYVGDRLQSFDTFRVNNLYRPNYVILKLNADISDPLTIDDSRFRIKGDGIEPQPGDNVARTISSHYGALVVTLQSQYGQIDSIKQVSISSGVHNIQHVKNQKHSSPIHFGGDVYINRFTEKNNMTFFNDWLFDQPNEFEYDYRNYVNIPYPRYWANFERGNYDLFGGNTTTQRHLNARESSTFYVKQGYFYLFNSGVRDFFVESEVNLALRDWEDMDSKRHYDPYEYTDISMMFRSDIIKSNNFYKYDYSLSNSRLFNSYISWGEVLGRDFDPFVAESCYSYYPKRVMYSLPQELELKKDNWKIFLANNYKDLTGNVTSIKTINKTGALIMMKNESPIQLIGVDQLQTDTGTKITIGDGGLFNQSLQNIVNADKSYQYGSCQNRYAVSGTPYGVFYISQEQGKIFNYANGLDEISKYGNKWWFSQYLPSYLLKLYPNYKLYDNPVAGIGCQVVYDNTNDIVYFTKKDYKPIVDGILLDTDETRFYLDGGLAAVTTPDTTTTECPTGYTLVDGLCTKVTSVPASVTTTSFQIAPSTWRDFGIFGTAIYSTFNSNGTGTFTMIPGTNPFWITPFINDNNPANDVGPVNRIAVWTNDGLNNYGTNNREPLATWVGFDVCINIPTTKIYYVAMAADNQFRISVDNTVLLTADPTAMGINHTADAQVVFRKLHIYPIEIAAGGHLMRLEGYNSELKAGFGCEIFDNTPAEIAAATSYDDLNVIFTTRNQEEFSTAIYSCPAGFGTDFQACDEPACVKTETAEPVVVVVPGVTTYVPIKNYIELTDPNYFEDASWTMSFDPKDKEWISPHDWHPNLLLPGKSHFMTVIDSEIWKHNSRCDSYCNFYGVDYPFEVEFVSATGQNVTTMKSIEYLLESYEYQNNCTDKFHTLDNNFDRAIIYNSEQISGVLKLNIKPKNNPRAILEYPKITGNGIDILYSKEENKYRFNQFYDITKDRGEFTNVPRNMFITRSNGYVFQINPSYIDYNKTATEHKKFRHHSNKVFLRKLVSGNQKIIFKIINVKNLNSPR